MAQALGVSESSLRRWVDAGAIATTRTVGGHRRIALHDALRFIRQSDAALLRPELLGLGELAARFDVSAEGPSDEDKLFAALRDGSLPRARGIVLSLYLTGAPLAGVFDGPVRGAMQRIGELWQHAPAGILVEHRASDLCLQVVNELRQTIAPPAEDGPLALGGAPEGDPYLLPSTMAAIILAEAGFRTINYGANTPARLLDVAAAEQRASLAWLSLSLAPSAETKVELETLRIRLHRRGVPLVLGGRHAAEVFPKARVGVQVMASMVELAAFATGLRSAMKR